MERIPVVFQIQRCCIPTVIKVTGTSQAFAGVDQVLITEALKIIEEFQKFDGIPCQFIDGEQTNISQNKSIVYFHMAFRNEEDILEAIQAMREGLG